jgi:hypothetical protein
MDISAIQDRAVVSLHHFCALPLLLHMAARASHDPHARLRVHYAHTRARSCIRWYEFVFFGTRALIIGSSILLKTALQKATMICLILCWAIHMHVRYVPFYSHGHRHIAANDRLLSTRERWKLQATHGDQLQLLCLVCELVAGLMGIACIFFREEWHSLPDDQWTGTMYLVDGVITLLSICCAFGPPISTLVMQKKDAEEHDAAMEAMDQKMERLSSLPTYVSATARDQVSLHHFCALPCCSTWLPVRVMIRTRVREYIMLTRPCIL